MLSRELLVRMGASRLPASMRISFSVSEGIGVDFEDDPADNGAMA